MANSRIFGMMLLIVALSLAAGSLAPDWLLFLVTLAASHGLAVLGVVVLTRGGGATFGQGLFFAIGAYVAALLQTKAGLNDAVAGVAAGGLVAGLLGAVAGPLLARYRGIFYAMLTLALSMVAYGILSKWNALGGTDGFNLARPSIFGRAMTGPNAGFLLYALTLMVCGLAGAWVAIYFRSASGLISLAVRSNALRVEYLGASSRASLAIDFTIASALGGLGGALTALALGHVDPQMAYWTTSGEFVFAAILSGYHSVVAVFLASLGLEVVRSFSNLYFPNTWQLVLGLFLLAVVLFLPGGIGSLWSRRMTRRAKPQAARAGGDAVAIHERTAP